MLFPIFVIAIYNKSSHISVILLLNVHTIDMVKRNINTKLLNVISVEYVCVVAEEKARGLQGREQNTSTPHISLSITKANIASSSNPYKTTRKAATFTFTFSYFVAWAGSRGCQAVSDTLLAGWQSSCYRYM